MPYVSEFPDLEIPNVTLYEEIFGTLTEDELKLPAMTDGLSGRSVTYGELKHMVDAFAGYIASLGVKPRDVVALHCPNSIAFAVAFHGAMRVGAAVTTVGVLYNEKDIHRQLENSGAETVITVHALGQAAHHAANMLGLPEERILFLDDKEHGLEAMIAKGLTPPEVDLDPADDLAALPYSSGTTGWPKGVMLTHRNLVANMKQIKFMLEKNGMQPDWTIVTPLPFFHIYGMTVMLNASLSNRNHLVAMASFELPDFLEIIQKFKAQWGFVAPPILIALAKHPIIEKYDLSSLEVLLSGAAPLDGELARAVQKRIGCSVTQGYGLTETSPVTNVTMIGDGDVASIGKAVPNTTVKVVDLTDPNNPEVEYPTEPGKLSPRGELWVKGPQVMKGYFKNEETTAYVLNDEGWLRTGDVVEADHEGNIYVVDRAKELVKYKGYQIAPAELEALLLTHPAIADAAVVPYNRPEDGEEIPRAFVVQAEGHTVDADEIMAWVAKQVTPYKKIRKLDVIDAIPKSVSGKILRRELKHLA